MAPTAPKLSHRAKALARIADPTLPRKVHRHDNTVTDAFLHSKRDKQLIRKASFRAQVAEKAGVPAKAAKRRRPSKKLVATLASLADALPDLPAAGGDGDGDAAPVDDGDEWTGIKRRARQSLRTRPGSLKRKEKLVQAERARFGLNLAQLTAVREETVVPAAAAAAAAADAPAAMEGTEEEEEGKAKNAAGDAARAPRASTASRFALLRNYITMTMDQSSAFQAS